MGCGGGRCSGEGRVEVSRRVVRSDGTSQGSCGGRTGVGVKVSVPGVSVNIQLIHIVTQYRT